MLDYGFRSKCCLAPIKVGTKRIKKAGPKITVWVCCVCKTKDCNIIPTADAIAIKNKDALALEIDDDDGKAD